MQISALIKCIPIISACSLPAGAGMISSTGSLTFNPIKLGLLIGWVYLCMYSVQRVQSGSLVSKQYKQRANVIAIFLGPIFLLVLQIKDMAGKYQEGGHSFLEIVIESLRPMVKVLKLLGLIRSKQYSTIKLVDTSGNNIRDIYRHGTNERENIHILNLAEKLVWDAIEERANDVLIHPLNVAIYTIRFQIDGIWHELQQLEADTCKAIINGIKAVSNMNVEEKRKVQGGTFIARLDETSVPIRVSSIGVRSGEKLSIKIQSQDSKTFTLTNIGLSTKQHKVIENALNKPTGTILICGPAASGKTTTLYAILNQIDPFIRSIATVEEPVEYALPNTIQMEVRPKAGNTFAKSLRRVLGQDPDIICLGKIQDEETANMALKASQTRHLVVAIIQCESTASAMIKLLDLGVPTELLASSLNLIISQRLLRKLCDNCKVAAELSESQIRDFVKRKINYRNISQAKGCSQCHETGYKGRTAIFDILVVDDSLKASIANSKLSITQLRKDGDVRGKSNLQKEGLKKVVSGTTSLEELKRIVR